MKNILDFTENECIRCESKEEANELMILFHSLGLKWSSGDSYLKTNNYFDYITFKTVYLPKIWHYGDYSMSISKEIVIYKAKDILEYHKNLENMKTEKTPVITFEIAEKMYNSNDDSLKDFALLNFPELAKPKYPERWEDCKPFDGFYVDASTSKIIRHSVLEFHKSNKNVFKTLEQAEASIALAQLSVLRDEYRDGWIPDFTDSTNSKYSIIFFQNDMHIMVMHCEHNFLSFQSLEIAELFLQNFKDLIMQALPLMS